MSLLFSTFQLRNITFRNRVFVSPMCQYSSKEGFATEWHLVHLGSRAVGGAGMVMTEATAVSPEGRISPDDLGIWSDEHIDAHRRLACFIREHGAVPAIQLAHAGRKASMASPWKGGQLVPPSDGGWEPVGPSRVPFASDYATPRELDRSGIQGIVSSFVRAAERSCEAGYKVVELHMAHGYLLHEFLSPISNHRKDEYGGALENRMRLPLDVTRAVRAVWPKELPLLVRISASDWVDGGWDLEQSIQFVRQLKVEGVDLVDCSSGGMTPDAKIPFGPGYQVPFAEAIRRDTAMATGAVGLITEPHQAERIIREGKADAVFLAREFLRNPYWPLTAARELEAEVEWPKQYRRAKG